jgi:hypothetical protein
MHTRVIETTNQLPQRKRTMLDLTANTPATSEKYANLIATRDLIEQNLDRLYQATWYGNGRYCFAGFACLIREGRQVGDVILNKDPELNEWLGMSPEDYEMLCYRIEGSDEVLDAIDAVIAGRTLYDSEGYDHAGYDASGLDAYGYDRHGFDSDGFDSSGFDASGYDENGFDEFGYDAHGFDVNGLDGEGYDCEGFDWAGYDRKGFDRDGYNCEGFDRDGFDRSGLDSEGCERDYPF